MYGGVGGRNCLAVAMDDLFNRMSGLSWEAVNRTQLWNIKRPVWLQAIIHLVEPHVMPAVLELMDLLDSVSIFIFNCIQRYSRRKKRSSVYHLMLL